MAHDARPLGQVIGALADVENVDLLIGPEGDFTELESEEAIEHGFQPVSLGPLTLRVETAVFYGISVLSYERNSRR